MADWPYNTTAWRRLRRAKLNREPMCQPCRARGKLTLANTVDHNVPINRGGDAFPALDGLTSMCGRCHNEKTATFDRGKPKAFARRVKGIDLDGNPFDHGDAWYAGGASDHQKERGVETVGEIGRYLVSKAQPTDNDDDLGFS